LEAARIAKSVQSRTADLAPVIAGTSRFTEFIDLSTQVVGSLLYLRLAIKTGDAAGHNMVTAAADRLIDWLIEEFPALRYVSVSGNYCTDKKVSAVNGILGRGKYTVAELNVTRALCERLLKTTPEKIVEINIKKNLIGSILAGGVRSANAHAANMLLAFYLATGQDAANIVEGSQGLVYTELRGSDLYFSVTLPNLIVGTVGAGKDVEFVRKNLESLGCAAPRAPGENSRRLAVLCAATVLCGELSLLAAQTNRHELMRVHKKLERK
jgi:hydroxymethylglutaryl-CoA reductase (NADPH)